MRKTTVLIVGAGPAGTACAWRLMQANVDCLLLDRHTFPRLKSCAGWITPGILRAIDFNPQEYPFSFTTFTRFHVAIRGFQFTLPTYQHAIRRIEFDHWLLQRCRAPLEQHNVRRILPVNDGFEIDGQYFANFLVGAGGTSCPVYRAFFQRLSPRPKDALILALEEEFPLPSADADCRLWFMQHGLPGYAWYVPKAGGVVNVGIGAKALKLKQTGARLQEHWQAFLTRLEHLGLVTPRVWQPVSHTYYLRHQPLAMRSGNAFLTGDAAGLATLDMGEGIAPAILSGLRAADAILHGTACTPTGIPRYSLPAILFAGLPGSKHF